MVAVVVFGSTDQGPGDTGKYDPQSRGVVSSIRKRVFDA